MSVGVVVLTTGRRPDELAAALASVARQREVDTEVVVVVNTGDDVALADVGDARVLRPGRNLGIPAGRNLAAAELSHRPLLLFLDDDAELVDDDVLSRVVAAFGRDPRLGAVTMRIVDPETGATQRRHVPRVRVGDPARSSWVTTLLGGACVVRTAAFEEVGGLPGEFFYALEETSLAWRLLDRGYRLRYDARLRVHHPAESPARHAQYHFLTARNRVLLARALLPAALAVVYLLVWTVLGLLRGAGGRGAIVRGLVAGLRRPVQRAPIRWATVARMARYGRPPLI